MRETDGRKLKHDVLEAIRRRAVQRIEDGESPEIVIKALGMNRRTIYKWIALYREQGVDALKATPLSGRPLKLSGAKLRWIFKTVITKNPLQLKFPYALWTREMVKERKRLINPTPQRIMLRMEFLSTYCGNNAL